MSEGENSSDYEFDVEVGVLHTKETGPLQDENIYLVDVRQTAIQPKNFTTEIRGLMDVQHLLKNAVVLLDVEQYELDSVLQLLVSAIPKQKDYQILYHDIQHEIFSYSIIQAEQQVSHIRRKLQCVSVRSDNVVVDQSWISIYCEVESALHRHVCFARFKMPTNFGDDLGDVQYVILVLAPINEKPTKSAFETARTFATVFCDHKLRQELADVRDPSQFIHAINRTADRMTFELPIDVEKRIEQVVTTKKDNFPWYPGRGIVNDFKRRIAHYKSDYTDGVSDTKSVRKTISTAFFLYFSMLPTVIALGTLNDTTTRGLIDVRRQLVSQCIGGLFFGITGGQLFLIMMSTAPISIYISVVARVAHDGGYDFFGLYTTIGLWCSIFLALLAVFEAAKVMEYSKRSLVELFGMFAATIALTYKAVIACIDALTSYHPHCSPQAALHNPVNCSQSSGLLFIILVLGTFWISATLDRFRSTPYLTKLKRELLSDYALPLGVVIMTLIGAYCFPNVPKQTFTYHADAQLFTIVDFWNQSWQAHAICFGLGIPLAVLFFMDQLIVTNTVDNTRNNLQKGSAKHWDLLVVAVLNAFLSLLGLPWVHGSLPQAFLHLKALADVEDRLVDGTIQQVIIKNRESRVATLLAHLAMIPTCIFLLPVLQLIPTGVFYGLFLFLAASFLMGNEFFERVLLTFTEQRSYPPLHYIRRVPQRVIHGFTAIQVVQLVVLCVVGFAPWPVVEMAFPIVTFLFIPFRSLVLPKFFDPKHLEALDPAH